MTRPSQVRNLVEGIFGDHPLRCGIVRVRLVRSKTCWAFRLIASRCVRCLLYDVRGFGSIDIKVVL